MSQSRQLAAIMFTDIVGYTAMMGKDEQNAFNLLRKNRKYKNKLLDIWVGIIINCKARSTNAQQKYCCKVGLDIETSATNRYQSR